MATETKLLRSAGGKPIVDTTGNKNIKEDSNMCLGTQNINKDRIKIFLT
jgi:hypothetical protein